MKKYLFYSFFIHLFLFSAVLLTLLEFGYLSFNENGIGKYTHVSVYENQVKTESVKSSDTNLVKSPLQSSSRQHSVKEKKSDISKNKYKINKNSSKISIENKNNNYDLLSKETGDKTNKNSVKGGNENKEAENVKSSAKPEYGANQKPEYPLVARRRGYEGEVIFNVHVLNDGNVGEMQMLKTSGYPVLDNSAYNALKNWKFVPGKFNGEYVPSWVKVPILFRLNDI